MACRICAYGYNLARWLDQGLNALTGGDPRQTVSSRLGRAELAGSRWAAAACRAISFVFREPDHCVAAVRAADNELELWDIDGPGDGP